ncbi:MAG: hypothetical protein AB7R69_01030 [Candidatus Babeliales bacterium]
MKKIMMSLLTGFMVLSVQATVLRNGVDVPQEKIDKVWSSLEKVEASDYYWTWRYSAADKKNYNFQGSLWSNAQEERKSITTEILGKEKVDNLHKLGLMQNNSMDEDTKNIILSSYAGTGDPKIIKKQYPVKSSAEKYIPGYFLYKIWKLFFGK